MNIQDSQFVASCDACGALLHGELHVETESIWDRGQLIVLCLARDVKTEAHDCATVTA